MKYLIKSESEKISGGNDDFNYSAVNLLKKTGGVYITYVGGDHGFQQETSTAQGWASALCGKWMKKMEKVYCLMKGFSFIIVYINVIKERRLDFLN